ncbi:Flp pilus assembly complex ATPase component TadA [bacterium]|nr:Flp pilus assembly complex ATPase component TadA [bacterium]
MDNTEYLDFDQAVSFLKTTPSTLYKWLQAGKIPGHKLGRQWRFLKEELDIHVSGKGSKINVQKDFLALSELLTTRSQQKENKMETNMDVIPEKIIWDAFDHGARNIHIYPAKGKYEISYRTQKGIEKLISIQEESFKLIDDSLTRISIGVDSSNSKRINLLRDHTKSEADVLQVKYQKLETVTGPRLTLRLWQTEKDVLPLEKITGDKTVLETFKKMATKTNGLIIVTGASGSGKTTTLYSLINEFKKKGHMVFTIEDTAELVIEGINQIEIKGKNTDQFEEVFEGVYSSDPDVICLSVGAAFDTESTVYNLAYKAASTGHLVVLLMHQASCKDAVSTFNKFVKFPTDHIIVGVSCQKLIEENGKAKAVYEFSNI